MTLFQTVALVFAIITLVTQAGALLLILGLFAKKTAKIPRLITKHATLLAFLLVLGSTLGSLFFSEIIGLEPCKLCWYQRMFMFPMALILLIAIIKKFKNIAYYVIPMAVIGFAIGVYQYVLQMTNSLGVCADGGTDCGERLIFEFGYITIPVMAISVFLTVTVLMVYRLRNKNK